MQSGGRRLIRPKLEMHVSIIADVSRAVSGVRRTLNGMARAESRALNDTAVQLQSHATQSLLPSKFTLRGKGTRWYEPRQRFGINIKFANLNSLAATVGSRADWLRLHEKGGVKTPPAKVLAIPTADWKRKQDIMARNKKPGVLIRAQRRAQKRIEAINVKLSGNLSTKQRRKLIQSRAQARRTQGIAGLGLNKTPFTLFKNSRPIGIAARIGNSAFPIKLLFSFVKKAGIKESLRFFPTLKSKADPLLIANMQRAIAVEIARSATS